jgi:hypothetical protein
MGLVKMAVAAAATVGDTMKQCVVVGSNEALVDAAHQVTALSPGMGLVQVRESDLPPSSGGGDQRSSRIAAWTRDLPKATEEDEEGTGDTAGLFVFGVDNKTGARTLLAHCNDPASVHMCAHTSV